MEGWQLPGVLKVTWSKMPLGQTQAICFGAGAAGPFLEPNRDCWALGSMLGVI